MKIAIVGTGYVGLVTGTCFAEMGIDVTCIDIDSKKIEKLRQGIIPIYEPGLEELVRKNIARGRLVFETELAAVVREVEVVFSAVGTPPGDDGAADLRQVLEVARTIGRSIDRYVLVVTKSTVPVGTAGKVCAAIGRELSVRGLDVDFDVASNPEFLKEGSAVDDFMRPDRIVVGVDSDRARTIMERLYRPFTLNGHPVLFMDVASAEMAKYAANAMLAIRISFMNEVAGLCEIVGADVNQVRRAIGADPRIGSKFLYAGCGYGGSCFPKDVKALYNTAREKGFRMRVVEATEETNEQQKKILFEKFQAHFDGDIAGRTVALWGLSFKPETDDMREAPSLAIITELLAAECKVRVYDPILTVERAPCPVEGMECCSDKYEAAEGADALLLVTEWKEFRMPDWARLREAMKQPVVIDGRNIYDGNALREDGFSYCGIGVK
ncbi:MAG: UDP-glucose/GDP-mannose dehydrogenase family protein [Rikenellaceae bacterium]|jgi:UDPglucose 6-dehydrogenase|nr:UDP-glucose/GDP-mannose dehydrogenase family protein [Rikenellaceae bacterium]